MLRMPLLGGDADSESNDASVASDERPSGGGFGRKLLAAVAAGGAAYLAARRLRSSGAEPTADGASDRSGDSSSDVDPISIGDAGAEESGPIEDAPGEERSPEEIAERVGEDVEQKPAEPGEMAIDEAVVEDAVDEAELSGADGDESDAAGEAEDAESGAEEASDEDEESA